MHKIHFIWQKHYERCWKWSPWAPLHRSKWQSILRDTRWRGAAEILLISSVMHCLPRSPSKIPIRRSQGCRIWGPQWPQWSNGLEMLWLPKIVFKCSTVACVVWAVVPSLYGKFSRLRTHIHTIFSIFTTPCERLSDMTLVACGRVWTDVTLYAVSSFFHRFHILFHASLHLSCVTFGPPCTLKIFYFPFRKYKPM